MISGAYLQFAPSLQLFAHYGAQNTNLLNNIKRNERQLSEFISAEVRLENALILPLEYYHNYQQELKEYYILTPTTVSSYNLLSNALEQISIQSDNIELKLKDEEERLQLLTLQNSFWGNPVIYTPTRKMIKEGEMERLKQSDKSEEIQSRLYYAHLFNDAFIFSTRNRLTGFLKLHTAVCALLF